MNKKTTHQIKILVGSIVVLIFSNCNKINTFPEIYFSVPNRIVKIGIDSLFAKNIRFKMPKKWQNLDNWSQRGLGFLDSKIFYFQSNPEEMYYVTFSHYTGEDSKTCSLGIMGVNQGFRWFEYTEITDSEKIRIEERFEREIVEKLQTYTHTKATVRDVYGAQARAVK
jgi:hypothetical protein